MSAAAQIDPSAIPRYRAMQGIDPNTGLPFQGNPQESFSPWQPAAAPGQVVTDPSTGGNPYGTPDNPNLNNPSTTNPVYGNVGAPPGGQSGQYATTGAGTNLPVLNTDPNQPIHNMFYNDQAIETGMGQQIYNEAQNQLGYYGPLQARYQGAQDTALGKLQQTPGYTNQEQVDIRGDPNQARADVIAGVGAEEGTLGQYGQNVNDSLGNLKTGLNSAQDKFSKLDTAVNNPALAFDPNGTEKQLTDADVQEMKTAAGTRVGNQYRSAEDTLMRQAAAQGNTSPLGVAAARARLEAQSAAGQGDAEVNADIAARQAQQDRAAQIEAQREGAVNTQTGYRAGAATTEQAQAQNAAALSGTQGVQAQQVLGSAALGQRNTETAQKSAASTAFDTANSQRSQDIAQTRIAGEGAYRSGVAQQQGLAQQGGQKAVDQQQGAANQVTSGLNTSTANRANYEVGTEPNSVTNQAVKAASAIFKEGGVVTEPTVGIIAEHGPEMVYQMPRYRRRERMVA